MSAVEHGFQFARRIGLPVIRHAPDVSQRRGKILFVRTGTARLDGIWMSRHCSLNLRAQKGAQLRAAIGRQQSVREAEMGRSETTKSAGTRGFVVRCIIFMDVIGLPSSPRRPGLS